LDKCVLVCSNCHKEIHANIRECPELLEGNDEMVEKAEKEFEENYNK
jgi:predicted HNH restriction endonuclease